MLAMKPRCRTCRTDVALPPFTMAFQPIVDIETAETYAYEAADKAHFPLHHLMFEVTENEPARDVGHLQNTLAVHA